MSVLASVPEIPLLAGGPERGGHAPGVVQGGARLQVSQGGAGLAGAGKKGRKGDSQLQFELELTCKHAVGGRRSKYTVHLVVKTGSRKEEIEVSVYVVLIKEKYSTIDFFGYGDISGSRTVHISN